MSHSDEEKATYDQDAGADVFVREVPSHDAASSSWVDRMKVKGDWLEQKIGMESQGIERVPDTVEARTDHHPSHNASLWLAANCVLSTFGLGILGPGTFYLGLGDSMLIILFVNIFTAVIPAYLATFGPNLGLRQMTSSRYSWGWHGAKIFALLNCVACIGWSSINTIAGSQALRVVADDKISHAVGVVVIAVITLFIGLFGYKWVHLYERFSWIPTAIAFLALLGCSARHFVNIPMGTGQLEASNALSFAGVIFGFTAGWVSMASDYNVYQPSSTPKWKTFAWTYIGLIIPLVLVMWLGAAVMCAAEFQDSWMEAFESNELGGLLGAAFFPVVGHGGGGFFLFLLVLSVVSNNIINVYSMGLSISVTSTFIAKLPQVIWPVLVTAIYVPIAIVGADSFAVSLENFMAIIGQWLAIFSAVVLEEHFIFRKGSFPSYNAEFTWNDPSALPMGLGALGAFCAGVIGAWAGMSQVWYIGPIGKLVGGDANPYGGDVGFILSGTFAAIVYPITRTLEKKWLKR
ncbi:permease for cytosine/purines, uracil, thiamine, allantoin-domain-containing protein [Mrakia frigida]|uniref:permease for cytosine/purines, uracil, thiamine, allantoin-domain-containing protein n=1 Tax=Mrakia frigida TaxID=29902 RepID=UPI003FCBF3EE